jgi:hypothetical protein
MLIGQLLAGPVVSVRSFLDLFLRFMMGKSHSPDKRPPQGRLRRRHDAHQAKKEFR